MKRFATIVVLIVLVLGGGAYAYRAPLRDWWEIRNRPSIPSARAFPDAAGQRRPSEPEVIIDTPMASQTYRITESKVDVRPADPLAFEGKLPDEINLDVPFLSQAPLQDWNYPYQEACEEASVSMVDGYYQGMRGKYDVNKGKTMIDNLVAYQKKVFGYYEDTTAAEVAQFVKDYLGYDRVEVRPYDESVIKQSLALGYPVILPASGRELKNPNFRNGGPPYHMLVIKGYLKDGRWITHDPGTRKGADYIYTKATLADAAHDYVAGNVTSGKKLMIVVLPKSR